MVRTLVQQAGHGADPDVVLEGFAARWRRHFREAMQPQFLPEFQWSSLGSGQDLLLKG